MAAGESSTTCGTGRPASSSRTGPDSQPGRSSRGEATIHLVTVLTLAVGACGDDAAPFEPPSPRDPPFSGTIFLDPDIITASDISTFAALSYAGQDSRLMFDRRVNDWIVVDAYLFDATFDDGLIAEVQVNPEFGGVAAAQVEAEKYAAVIGRLPHVLRTQVEAVWSRRRSCPGWPSAID